jgi:hypothetical protein
MVRILKLPSCQTLFSVCFVEDGEQTVISPFGVIWPSLHVRDYDCPSSAYDDTEEDNEEEENYNNRFDIILNDLSCSIV